MNKTNKSIPKKKAKNEPDAVLCVSCDRYFYSGWIQKRKDGNYCGECSTLTVRAQRIRNQVKDEEVEKMAKTLLNTPPRKKNKKKKGKN